MGLLGDLKNKLSGHSKHKDVVFGLYTALVEEARNPVLYADYGIPDTLDGRFDSIVLHLTLFGLATNDTLAEDKALKDLGKNMIGVFLKDMDRNLREIGVGDLSVGKKVKKMASALYGRIDAYSRALSGRDKKTALLAAIRKNVFRDQATGPEVGKKLTAYGLERFKGWQKLTLADIRGGNLG